MKEVLFYPPFLYNRMLLRFSERPFSSQLPQTWVQQGSVCLRPFCQKKNKGKDHVSSADSMTAGLAISKTSLGLRSPSSKTLFLSLVWILVGSLRLPTDPSGPQCRRGGRRLASPASRKELWHNPGVSWSHEKWFVGSGPQGPLFQSRAAIV